MRDQDEVDVRKIAAAARSGRHPDMRSIRAGVFEGQGIGEIRIDHKRSGA
jgi:hypothetical protein